MSMTNLQGIICWAHARYFFTLTKMVAGYRVKSSPLQAIHQFNPSQPTEILSMKIRIGFRNKRYGRTMSQGPGGKQRTKKENSTVKVELRFG
jgi:hypothetical protein